MNTTTLARLDTRLHRVERQNRILLVLLCAIVGFALLGATKGGGNVITATQVRTQRLTLIDNRGKPLVDTQGVDGVEIHAYLPHDVVQH